MRMSTTARIMSKFLINDQKIFPVTEEFKESINLSTSTEAEIII